jgi:hypothetical protein
VREVSVSVFHAVSAHFVGTTTAGNGTHLVLSVRMPTRQTFSFHAGFQAGDGVRGVWVRVAVGESSTELSVEGGSGAAGGAEFGETVVALQHPSIWAA